MFREARAGREGNTACCMDSMSCTSMMWVLALLKLGMTNTQGTRGQTECLVCQGRGAAHLSMLHPALRSFFPKSSRLCSPLPTANIHTSRACPFHTFPTLQTEQGYRLAHLGEGKEAVGSYDSPLTVYEEVSPGNLKYDLEDAKLLQV